MTLDEKIQRAKKDYDRVYAAGQVNGSANLPDGYLKVDPTWTSWYMLCNGRPSIVQNLKYEDSSNVTNFTGAFQNCNVKTIPRLDFRKATTISSLYIYSSKIEEIGEMEIPNVTNADYAFSGCTGLKRISFVPNCIKVPLNFSSCGELIEYDSLLSIIEGLMDLTGQPSKTITFHPNAGKSIEAQLPLIMRLQSKNWILAYDGKVS